ncbi:MAG: S-methyl-5-thioribose-1-phosphate isomerase [Rickettsiales bacterium]|nr:S-methyl-5-thioribose-1-phosphate isomerase [Rickettsiales bacterium]|tara:strand:- start:1259 stop:2341 length:1083 start_codon:yes stop_codon:yes gene_type:complete
MNVDGKPFRTVDFKDGELVLIDQPRLPHRFELWRSSDYREIATAISTMVVRGAGAIGATGAYGLAIAARQAPNQGFMSFIDEAESVLSNTRPTAQNLFAGLSRVRKAIAEAGGENAPQSSREAALNAAHEFADRDAQNCQDIGRHGSVLLQDGWGVSTHCNAGWLAFVDWGSALSPVYQAAREGKRLKVFVDETRPRGQGSRLTAWELAGEGIEHAVIADNAFAHLAAQGEIQAVITGADRVAANGDVANKIGTHGHAIIARHLGIPFYVALPSSTVDPDCPNGTAIPIEERSGDEVRWTLGEDEDGELRRVRTTPKDCQARNPAFDVTPAELIDGLISESGIYPASSAGVRALLGASKR